MINIGIWCIELCDDGSLDTVLEVFMRLQPHISYTSRFDCEFASFYRDDSGALTEEGFRELAEDAVDWAECCRELTCPIARTKIEVLS